ncbi:MAG: LPS export ABC transporter ATP-binding protein [Deltaproteobacteria bacterium]|nr:LPS export ABC transporter ATP-binding protein [Deltaproteobacteria bacterium]
MSQAAAVPATTPTAARTALRASGLVKRYGARTVVDGVSFDVLTGEVVGLLGPNGAGKSTSFHMVAGLVTPDGGEVTLADRPLHGRPLYERARSGLGYLPQEASIFRGLSVRDNLLAVLEGMPLGRAERAREADALLAEFSLAHVAGNKGSELSGGERRRAEIARALCTRPTHLLFDEPFAGVDPIAVAEIQRVIMSLKARGLGILITDHNVRETLNVCDRAYLISKGRILLAGSPREILESAVAREVYLGEGFQ